MYNKTQERNKLPSGNLWFYSTVILTKGITLEDKILIAVIAAGSALLGSLIPSVLTFLNNNKQRQFEVRKMLLDKQKEAYRDLLVSLQEFGNNSVQSNEYFYKFQNQVLQVVIYGEDSASKAVNDYYQELVNKKSLSNEEHRKHHSNILNTMRRSLGLGKISNFSLTRFTSEKA